VLHVRRFFCDDESCARTTFVEQLTDFLRPYAQRTNALNTSLQILGLALGGEAGASLGIKLGLAASADTILRRGCRRTSLQPKASPIAFCYDQ
jgi:hypothetical protein